MKNSTAIRIVLLIAGLPAVGIGLSLLLTPVSFQASSGIELAGHISLLSETRSAGGALTVIGAMILSGAFVSTLSWFSLLTASAVYLAYGLSRVLSITVDGVPHVALLYAMAAELAVGLMGVFALMRYSGSTRPRADGLRD